MTAKESPRLTTEPDAVQWPATHYVSIEKIGAFPTTAPEAWSNLHQQVPTIAQHNTITGYCSLYKMKDRLYRAGVALAAAPSSLPAGLRYEVFPGGKYARFVLTGPYSQLPEASGRVWRIVEETRLSLRDDYNIENYARNPNVTPADELIAEILFPLALTLRPLRK